MSRTSPDRGAEFDQKQTALLPQQLGAVPEGSGWRGNMMQHHIEDNQIAAHLLLAGNGGVSEDKANAFSAAVADGLPGAFQHVAGIVQGGQIAGYPPAG